MVRPVIKTRIIRTYLSLSPLAQKKPIKYKRSIKCRRNSLGINPARPPRSRPEFLLQAAGMKIREVLRDNESLRQIRSLVYGRDHGTYIKRDIEIEANITGQ